MPRLPLFPTIVVRSPIKTRTEMVRTSEGERAVRHQEWRWPIARKPPRAAPAAPQGAVLPGRLPRQAPATPASAIDHLSRITPIEWSDVYDLQPAADGADGTSSAGPSTAPQATPAHGGSSASDTRRSTLPVPLKTPSLPSPRVVTGLQMAGYYDLSARYRSDADTRSKAMHVLDELTADSMARYELDEFEAQYQSDPVLGAIPKEDLIAVRAYTAHFHQLVNPPLIHGRQTEVRRVAPMIAAIVSGLNQLPTFVGTVYRGKTLSNSERSEFAVGHEVTLRGFTSTSTSADRAHNGAQRFVIQSIDGATVSGVSVNWREEEVLFRPGSRFKVEKIVPVALPANVNPRFAHLLPREEIHLTQLA